MELLPSKLKKQVASYEGKALSRATQSKMQQLSSSASSSNVAVDTTGTATETAASEKKIKDEDGGDGVAGKEEAVAAAAVVAPTTTTIDKAQELRTKCADQASLSYSKTASLIQHIVPITPPGEVGKKPVEPVLHLTKKERKRARKRRREQKQRELQDLQAAGLIEPLEPRLTLQNFIRVMGDQGYVDPSQMERTIMEQVQKLTTTSTILERNESVQETHQGTAGRKTPQQGIERRDSFRERDGSDPRGSIFRQERVPSVSPYQDRPHCATAQHYRRGCRMRGAERGVCHL